MWTVKLYQAQYKLEADLRFILKLIEIEIPKMDIEGIEVWFNLIWFWYQGLHALYRI